MSSGQTLLDGFFQATGRKRPSAGSIPSSKRTKDISTKQSPAKSIISTDFVSLHKEQKQISKQNQTRTAKQAPARKPRGSKKLMQTSVCPTIPKNRKVNKQKNETFVQIQASLIQSKPPLEPSTPLNSGLKALTATKQGPSPAPARTPQSPMVTSPNYPTPVILKIPKTPNSNLEQVSRVRRKLLTQLEDTKEGYKVPPLPNQQSSSRASKLSLAKRLAQPTPVETKVRNIIGSPVNSLPVEIKDDMCLSPKREAIIRKLALLKTPDKSPKMKEFREIQFSSPTKTPSTSPLKSPPRYQKFHHLSSDSQMPVSHSHSVLLEHFRCMDVVLSMLDRRRETCTFEKLQKSVSTMNGKQLTLKHVAQILHIYPSSFSLSYQPLRTSINSPRRGQQQLIVAANYDFHCESPTRNAKPRSLTNQDLLARNKQMRAHVIDYIMGHHDKFLRSFSPPIRLSSEQIKRWHPAFNLDSVPAVPEGRLPKKPQSNTPQTAKQVLESSHDLLPTRISRVMQRLVDEKSSTEPQSEDNDETTDMKRPVELKGVSKNLIERIRLKEQEKVKLNMVRDDGLIHKLDMLERLPEICSIVRNMYLAEKRGTLPWADVLYKLKESHHSKMDQKSLEEHLNLLLETLPNWASSVKLKNTKFLKVKRNTPLNTLLSELECEKSRLEA